MKKASQPQLETIKNLREKTQAGVMDCRKALIECQGDEKKAIEWLKKKGIASALKKAEREVNSGLIETYTHPGSQVGSMIELACETDFVARTDEFKKLAHEICLQAAACPVKSLDDFLSQPYIRDEAIKVKDLIKESIGKLGENIILRRVCRFKLGDPVEKTTKKKK